MRSGLGSCYSKSSQGEESNNGDLHLDRGERSRLNFVVDAEVRMLDALFILGNDVISESV